MKWPEPRGGNRNGSRGMSSDGIPDLTSLWLDKVDNVVDQDWSMSILLAKVKEIVDNSTSPAAKDFDASRWLDRWIERPQPALGGCKPAELIQTLTGVETVLRLLGSLESGSYR